MKLEDINYPYKDVPEEQLARLSFFVTKDDAALVRGTTYQRGTILFVAGILWHKFCERLREAGITDFTQEQRMIHYVNNFQLTPVDGYTVQQPGGQKPAVKAERKTPRSRTPAGTGAEK